MAVSQIDNNGVNLGQLGNRNLIVNSAMQVAQRGTSATTFSYATVDRWKPTEGSTSTLAILQEPTNDAPSGFGKSYKITTTTAETMSGSKQLAVFHAIEAQNLQQLGYGTSDAQSITVSFWVKSSVTGAYCLSLYENDDNRNIGATYTINSANTWEYKTITFPPDTVGVINNDNGAGLETYFFLSVGPDRKTADNTSWAAWSAARFGYGQVADVAGTTNATWQITGVQLEVGDTATPFEHRSYSDEIQRCQRYFFRRGNTNNLSSGYDGIGAGTGLSTSTCRIIVPYPCEMRAKPTCSFNGSITLTPATGGLSAINANYCGDSGGVLDLAEGNTSISEGTAIAMYAQNASGDYFDFDAEL